IRCVLYGSLGATGIGHGTPAAVLVGLTGELPETVDPALVSAIADLASERGALRLPHGREVTLERDWLRFAPLTRLDRHSNALTLEALDHTGNTVLSETYYSIGGGFIEHAGDEPGDAAGDPAAGVEAPFRSGDELLEICAARGLSIAEVMRAAETRLRSAAALDAELDEIWATMSGCIDSGLSAIGVLPGGLQVARRAARMATTLQEADLRGERDTSHEWLQAYAIAVNEENASGGRVVTAPTNGAAGIIPAVLRYAIDFLPLEHARPHAEFLLVAGAIGSLYKRNASISGAEAGCQGEVGSACSMAAGALCHLLGGTPAQVENAAEIAMEHNLGLTCDPVAGLVQLPCIERNAIGAGKAVAAARMALNGDGSHVISLDTVIETMRQTGNDMSERYKETSLGGLAVNVVEC
ncbi:L-serine ammonia-lyase, partial [Leucobacter sp. M11]|uniref:L-serine ammonia-lyase n=1 Tax=Leucobacter sp. M11 TaxID=2993565 RepID=UPI002D806216